MATGNNEKKWTPIENGHRRNNKSHLATLVVSIPWRNELHKHSKGNIHI